ncbi:AAA family ATPase [Streptomyces lavendulae]|uniref:AAA family ATPase n=1 Tax=Streptomyces lavendulae TaxID=1914 RepID=UPI0033D973F6
MSEAPALAGRRQETAALTRAVEELSAGRGTVLEVAGDPGIGKTALLNLLARLAAERGATVLRARARSGEAKPYQVFRDAWKRSVPPAAGPVRPPPRPSPRGTRDRITSWYAPGSTAARAGTAAAGACSCWTTSTTRIPPRPGCWKPSPRTAPRTRWSWLSPCGPGRRRPPCSPPWTTPRTRGTWSAWNPLRWTRRPSPPWQAAGPPNSWPRAPSATRAPCASCWRRATTPASGRRGRTRRQARCCAPRRRCSPNWRPSRATAPRCWPPPRSSGSPFAPVTPRTWPGTPATVPPPPSAPWPPPT